MSALAALTGSDLVASVPGRLAALLAGADLVGFDIPPALPAIEDRRMWHDRTDGDTAARCLCEVVAAVAGEGTRCGCGGADAFRIAAPAPTLLPRIRGMRRGRAA